MQLPPILPRIDVQAIIQQYQQQQQTLQQQLLTMQSMGASQAQLHALQQALQASEGQQSEVALRQAKDSYRLMAHQIAQARSPHAGEEGNIRRAFLNAMKLTSELQHYDLAFVDLSICSLIIYY